MKKNIYTVITGDLISSKEVTDRASLQEKVRTVMSDINKEFNSYLVVPFNFTAGDEFQGLLSEIGVSFDLAQRWMRGLFPWRARLGVGVGELSTPVAETTSSMDGQCFHRAREAIEVAKKEKRYLFYNIGDFVLDTSINMIILLMEAIQKDWKEIHYRRYWLYKQLGTLKKVAIREGVSRQAVVKTLKVANYEAILEAEKSVRDLLVTFQSK